MKKVNAIHKSDWVFSVLTSLMILAALQPKLAIGVENNQNNSPEPILKNFNLECKPYLGAAVTVKVRANKPGSFYPLKGSYVGPSQDNTTSTLLRSTQIKDLQGDSDVWSGDRVIVLSSKSQPNRKVVMDAVFRVGQKVNMAHLIIWGGDYSFKEKFKCTVVESGK